MKNIKEGYLRVSDILSVWCDFSNIDPYVLSNKCRIGTNVHAKIAAQKELIYIELQEDEKGYYDSWIKCKEKYFKDCETIEAEKRLYCERLKITGCIDCLIKKDRKNYVIDYKTSARPNLKTWSLQAAFYHYLCRVNDYVIEPYVFFVQLKKDGKTAKIHKISIDDELRRTAEAALKIYRYFND